MFQILGHLKANESASYNDGPTNLVGGHIGLDAVCIVHISKREDTLTLDTGQGWNNR